MTGLKSEKRFSKQPQPVERSQNAKRQWICSDILEATGGDLLQGDRNAVFSGISTDTRTLKAGQIFLALKGEQFDGHAFIEKALEGGAGGAIGEKRSRGLGVADRYKSKPLIAVHETLQALGDLARFWRNRFSLPLIGVTGSNGKTTTKELIAFLLEENFRVLKSPGNFNNLIGLPLALLDLDRSHKIAVVEMGTNVPGEIRRLAEIARPTIGLITNIGQAHLAGMGSLETVKEEKGALFRAVSREGVLVVNQNDPHVVDLARDCPAKKIGFGIDTEADVTIDRIQSRGPRGIRFRLTMGCGSVAIDFAALGQQFASNVAAAAAVAFLFEMDTAEVKKRLERFHPLPMRMEMISLRGLTVINDAYNANPASVKMALSTLGQASGKARAFVVLGDMLELGSISQTAHRTVGRCIGRRNVAGLFLMGDHAADVAQGAIEAGMKPRDVQILRYHDEIASLLAEQTRPGDWILVKGSRRMRMEAVIESLRGAA
jgi:UDP-N-acetylmuramoyl-tripeptide--D-alanyl-D-alanine ligase